MSDLRRHPHRGKNEGYEDGSDHRSCGICGFCVDCGDCRALGCTSDNWEYSVNNPEARHDS